MCKVAAWANPGGEYFVVSRCYHIQLKCAAKVTDIKRLNLAKE